MTICKHCDYLPNSNHCFICGKQITDANEPARSAGSESRSSEWVEELEAAHRHAQAARDGIEKRDGNGTHTYGLNGAIVLLTLAYETERSRSSTILISDRL